MEQQHAVLVCAVLAVFVKVRFNTLGVPNGSVLVLFKLWLTAAHKPARAHCVVPLVLLVRGPDFHCPLGQLDVHEPVLLWAEHGKHTCALLKGVVVSGELLRNNVCAVVPKVGNVANVAWENVH